MINRLRDLGVLVNHNFDTDEAAKLLALAGNAARLQVLELVCQQEWDVGSLAKEVNLSQSALSQHLKKLRDGNLVNTRRNAQTVYYSCKSDAVAALLTTLREIYEIPSKNAAGTR